MAVLQSQALQAPASARNCKGVKTLFLLQTECHTPMRTPIHTKRNTRKLMQL
jgi:hypothetical protein